GLASDGNGGLYVADPSNHAIRRIALATRAVTTAFANVGAPIGIVRSGGMLYVADFGAASLVGGTHGGAIRTIELATGAVATLAGAPDQPPGHVDAVGAAARFGHLRGLVLDDERLLVADGCTLRSIDVATTDVHTVAGDPAACEHVLGTLFGLALDGH